MYFEPQATFQNGYNIWLSPGSPGFSSRRWKFLSPQKRVENRPGIEPGSTAWKAAMLTIIPPTPVEGRGKKYL